MLLYVVSRLFPLKTFVILCNPSDTIAKVRANLLHMLYELDKLTHFQLRLGMSIVIANALDKTLQFPVKQNVCCGVDKYC